MTQGWELYKKGFDKWENATAHALEVVLKSPTVLSPSASLLSSLMKVKARLDRAVTGWWHFWGLSTRGDQERILHALNQIQSRMMDLEEKLDQRD